MATKDMRGSDPAPTTPRPADTNTASASTREEQDGQIKTTFRKSMRTMSWQNGFGKKNGAKNRNSGTPIDTNQTESIATNPIVESTVESIVVSEEHTVTEALPQQNDDNCATKTEQKKNYRRHLNKARNRKKASVDNSQDGPAETEPPQLEPDMATPTTAAPTSPLASPAPVTGLDGLKGKLPNANTLKKIQNVTKAVSNFRPGHTATANEQGSVNDSNSAADVHAEAPVSPPTRQKTFARPRELTDRFKGQIDKHGRKVLNQSTHRLERVINDNGLMITGNYRGDTNRIGDSYQENTYLISQDVHYHHNANLQDEKIIIEKELVHIKEQIWAEPDKPEKWLSEISYNEHHGGICSNVFEGSGTWLFEKSQYKAWESETRSSCLWIHGNEGIGKTMIMSTAINRVQEVALNMKRAPRIAYFYCSSRNTAVDGRANADAIMRTILLQLSIASDGCCGDMIVREYKTRKNRNIAPSNDDISKAKDPKKKEKERSTGQGEHDVVPASPKDTKSKRHSKIGESSPVETYKTSAFVETTVAGTTSGISPSADEGMNGLAEFGGESDQLAPGEKSAIPTSTKMVMKEPDQLSAEECGDVALAAIGENPAIILIDGVNECNPDEAHRLLRVLSRVLENSSSGQNNLKIIISHRDAPQVPFISASTILVSEADTRADFERFIDNQVEIAQQKQETTIGHGSWQNVAIWLKKHAGRRVTEDKSLANAEDGDILAYLQRGPATLKGSYLATLEKINEMKESDCRAAKNVLRWIVSRRLQLSPNGRRMLTTREVISFATRSIKDESPWTLPRILDICCKLVIHNQKEDVLYLSSIEVHDFLAKQSEFTKDANNTYIFRECLQPYMERPDPEDRSDAETGFFDYATLNWPFHYREISAEGRRSPEVSQELQKFLNIRGFKQIGLRAWMMRIKSWCQDLSDCKLPEHTRCEQKYERDDSDAEFTMLCDSLDLPLASWWFLASTFGFAEIFYDMHGHPDVERQNNKYSTGLHLASKWNQFDIVKIWLLAMGRNRSVSSLKTGHPDKAQRVSPLYYAVRYGHEKILRLFLTRDLEDLNTSMLERRYMIWPTIDTPVIVAVRHQQIGVLKMLLEQYTTLDINQKFMVEHSKTETGRLYTVLSLAVKKGSESMVKLLLSRNDIQVNAHVAEKVGRHEFAYSVLSLAVKYNQARVVNLLLEDKGVKYNSEATTSKWPIKDVKTVPPIVAAGMHGRMDVLEILLKLPDLELNNTFRKGTALTWACINGHKDVVARLLTIGSVDVNHKDERDKTPLIYAAYHERQTIVGILCHNEQVDVNCRDDKGRSALYYAVVENLVDMVAVLLSRDDIEIQEEVLWRAVERGYGPIVKLLLARHGNDFQGVKTFHGSVNDATKQAFIQALMLLREEKRMDITCFAQLMWWAFISGKEDELKPLKKFALPTTDEQWKEEQKSFLIQQARRQNQTYVLQHLEANGSTHVALHTPNTKLRYDMRSLCLSTDRRASAQPSLRIERLSTRDSERVYGDMPNTLEDSDEEIDGGRDRNYSVDQTMPAPGSIFGSSEGHSVRYEDCDPPEMEDDLVTENLIYPPLKILEDMRVNRKGDVLDEEGDKIGELEEGSIQSCAGKKINAKGEVLDKDGNVVGRVTTIPHEPPPEIPPIQCLEGFKVNKSGKVLNEDAVIIGELESGDLKDCLGKRINGNGEILDGEANVVGKFKVLPREDPVPTPAKSPPQSRASPRSISNTSPWQPPAPARQLSFGPASSSTTSLSGSGYFPNISSPSWSAFKRKSVGRHMSSDNKLPSMPEPTVENVPTVNCTDVNTQHQFSFPKIPQAYVEELDEKDEIVRS